MAKSYFTQPSVYRLPVLIEMIADGQILIARFQRPFVWRDEKRLLLLDSIMRGMPIGSLMIWRTLEHELKTYKRLGPYEVGQPKAGQQRTYLLDGHQRLASLYGAFREPPQEELADDESPDNGKRVRWPIFADLERSEVVFKLLPRSRQKLPPVTLLPVWKLLNPLQLYEHQKRLIDDKKKECARRAEELASQFKDYQIPVMSLVTEDLEQVTQSFQRVNSQGSSMSEVHMINALMWSREFDLNERLKQIAEELSDIGWGSIEPQVLLDIVKVSKDIDVYRGEPWGITRALQEDRVVLDALVANVRAAAHFLSEKCGVKGPAILPYKYQLVLLAEAARHSGGKLQGGLADQLERWFWRTTYGEYFTGMTGSQIRRAAEHVRAMVEGALDEPSEESHSEVKPLQRFDFNSVRGRAFVLLLARQGAKDATDKRMRADEIIAEAGSDAVPKILTSRFFSANKEARQLQESPENRWVVTPGHAAGLLTLLQNARQSGRTQRILQSHAIPREAAQALQQKDFEQFLALRRRHLLGLEREFVMKFGLRYSLEESSPE